MRRSMLYIFLVTVVGCGVTATSQLEVQPQPDAQVVEFDPAICADALAKQAEMANESPAFKASEVLDGILNQSLDCGIPAEFVERVRHACPEIGSRPPVDLSTDQVARIRSIR